MVTEASIEDYEEGLMACSEAAKTWMKVCGIEHGRCENFAAGFGFVDSFFCCC